MAKCVQSEIKSTAIAAKMYGKESFKVFNLRTEPPCLCGIYSFASGVLCGVAFSLLSCVRRRKLNPSPAITKTTD